MYTVGCIKLDLLYMNNDFVREVWSNEKSETVTAIL